MSNSLPSLNFDNNGSAYWQKPVPWSQRSQEIRVDVPVSVVWKVRGKKSVPSQQPDYILVFQCLTSKGRELIRVSLVAEGGSCIMDELVKPDNKILDYLTSFSGITKKILNPITTKLQDVQQQLKMLLPPDAVLVGHSLDLDLRALKVSTRFRADPLQCQCLL